MREPQGRAHLTADHARYLEAPGAGVLPRALGRRRIALIWALLAAVLLASASVWLATVERRVEFAAVTGSGGVLVLLDDAAAGLVQPGQRVVPTQRPGEHVNTTATTITAVDEQGTAAAALRARFGIPATTELPPVARTAWIALPAATSPFAVGATGRVAVVVGRRRAIELVPLLGPLFSTPTAAR